MELTHLKQENSTYDSHLKQEEDHSNQLAIENHELNLKMQQLKDLFERHDQTITRIHDKINHDKTIS